MNEDPNQSRVRKQRARKSLSPDWQPDLNPNRLAGEDARTQSDAQVDAEWTAFHLRKRGMDPGAVNRE